MVRIALVPALIVGILTAPIVAQRSKIARAPTRHVLDISDLAGKPAAVTINTDSRTWMQPEWLPLSLDPRHLRRSVRDGVGVCLYRLVRPDARNVLGKIWIEVEPLADRTLKKAASDVAARLDRTLAVIGSQTDSDPKPRKITRWRLGGRSVRASLLAYRSRSQSNQWGTEGTVRTLVFEWGSALILLTYESYVPINFRAFLKTIDITKPPRKSKGVVARYLDVLNVRYRFGAAQLPDGFAQDVTALPRGAAGRWIRHGRRGRLTGRITLEMEMAKTARLGDALVVTVGKLKKRGARIVEAGEATFGKRSGYSVVYSRSSERDGELPRLIRLAVVRLAGEDWTWRFESLDTRAQDRDARAWRKMIATLDCWVLDR